MTTIGEAFIEVHADTKAFDAELAKKLKASLGAADKKLAPESKKLGENISKKVGDGVDKQTPWIRRALRRIGDLMDKEGKGWVAKLKAPFEKMAKGNFILTRIFGQMVVALGGATRKVVQFTRITFRLAEAFIAVSAALIGAGVTAIQAFLGFGGDLAKQLSTVQSTAVQLSAALAAFAAQIAAMAPSIIAVVAVLALLSAAIAAVVAILIVALAPFATLIGFLTLLPTLVTGAIVTLIPFLVVMHGITDAFAALQEKDPKKFAEKLKGLPPVMQQLVRAVKPVLPILRVFRDNIQAAFLGPILTALQPFLKTVIPALGVGLTAISEAIGNIALSIMRLLMSREALDGLNEIMGQIALFLQENSGTITELIRALGRVAVAMLPSVLELFTKFGGFLSDFAKWIEGAITDGRFQGWLDTAIKSAAKIWGLIKALINLFKTLFSSTDEGGRKFLDKITRAINKFTTWLQSPDGQEALDNAVTVALAFADAFKAALQYVVGVLETINKIVEAIKWIRDHQPFQKDFSGQKDVTPSPSGGKLGKKKKSFSGGGVVPEDEIAMVHKGEPILDPANSIGRNRQILADAGMLDTLSSAGSTIVNVYLGTERLDERVDYRIAKSNRVMARTLATGTRSV